MSIAPSTEGAVGNDGEVSTGGPLLAPTSVAAATWALFCGLALIMVGNGLNGALLGLRSEREGFGLVVAGLVMASYFAGFLVGSRFVEHILGTVGHIRVFAALASAASSVVLVHALAVDPVLWAAMRFLFGMCVAGLYVVVESWLNDAATNANRARLLSVYMLVSMGGLSLGQLLLNVADPDTFRLFVVSSILVSMALVPVTLSASSAPPVAVPEPMGVRELVRIAPIGVASSLLTGVGQGALIGLGAVYASNVGMTEARLSAFIAAPMIGAVVFQWPVGWIADRSPRRGVILVVSSIAALLAGLLLMLGDGTGASIATIFLFGGATYPLYSLTLAYTNDWLTPERMVGAGATLVRIYGSGSIVGPVIGAVLMGTLGAHAYFWTLLVPHVVIVGVVAWRMVVRDPLPVERQRAFVPFPARSSALAATLFPRRRRAPENSTAASSDDRPGS